MHTNSLTKERIAESVWAVPPLARNADYSFNATANAKMIAHLEAGGMTTILYGGNAVFYHVALSEYGKILESLVEHAAQHTLIIPSVGPAYGMMMDQASLLREFDFATAMILPQGEVATPAGRALATARFADRFGKPVVLYIKHDRAVNPADVGRLMQEGVLSAIKYAVPRDNPAQDDYLRELIDAAGTERLISGLGDQPAPVHLSRFGLPTFTTGCGCVAPKLCMALLAAIRAGQEQRVAEVLEQFAPLESLRNQHGVISVLHEAITLAGIAEMGPIAPLLSAVDTACHAAIRSAAINLLQVDAST